MKVTVTRMVRQEIDVRYVKISVPVNYETEDMPDDTPGRDGDQWTVTIDVDTGKIEDWRDGFALDLYMKVCDGGTYILLDADRNVIMARDGEYVPHGVIPGEYGDYVELDIAADGTITNWPSELDVSDFFPDESDD